MAAHLPGTVTSVPPASGFYLPSLDGIRACAFLLVFLAHAGLEHLIPGGLGVTIFFFLSGYLITTLLRKEFATNAQISLRAFYIRRSLRILPPMYITLALSSIIVCILPSMRRATWLGVVSAIAYFYNYANLLHNDPAKLPAGIGVIWSLMIEEHFYLLFPLAYARLLRSRLTRYQQGALLASLCVAALLWRCYLVLVMHTAVLTLPRWTYSATDTRFDSILWGCIMAIVWNPVFADGPKVLNRNAGKLAALGMMLLGATLVIRNPVMRETLRYSLQSIALLPVFYYCVARPTERVGRALQWPVLRWIGWLSYSMYLAHEFFFAVIRTQFRLSAPSTAALVFVLVLIYAFAMRYFIELPSRDLQRTFTHPMSAQLSSSFSRAVASGSNSAKSYHL